MLEQVGQQVAGTEELGLNRAERQLQVHGDFRAAPFLKVAQPCRAATEAACPRLVLLDMNMPVLNGLAFLEAYAQLPLAQRHAIVIVMLTTTLHPAHLAHAQ